MKRFLLHCLFLLTATGLSAQTARQEIKENVNLSASNYLAYPTPQKKLTPAPKGMKPFYISHYGRHGSRHLNHIRDYNYPYEALMRADELGKLTPLGKDVLKRLTAIRADSWGRMGELTLLGEQQHRDIARRMYERFPEVFADGVTVDARSTVVIRCILSMESALQELVRMNPKLRITHDASQADMYYMNLNDPKIWNNKMGGDALNTYEAYCNNHMPTTGVLYRLVNDSVYADNEMNASRMNAVLYKLSSELQNTELRNEFTLFDIFTEEEIYQNWLKSNAWWYVSFGFTPLNGGIQPFSQRNLVRAIIQQTDSSIRQESPGATLRYGHETIILPLTCLMGINGYDLQTTDLEQLEQKGWFNYKVFPMAANLQFIFYRKGRRAASSDDDIVFKVLLNENEATLPIETDMAPYYHWKDFREFCLKRLEAYPE